MTKPNKCMKSNPSCVLTKEVDIIDVVIWTSNMQKCGLFISSLELKFKVGKLIPG
jgi:hypothetical protein